MDGEYGKVGITALTKGYPNLNQYDTLIRRNIAIEENCNNPDDFEFVLFHEGNIPLDHQNHINSKTQIKFKFIDIREIGKAFRDKNHIEFDPETIKFKLNYRHMCSFWFVDFWNYVEDFSRIVRIDEDCIVDFNLDNLMLDLESYSSIYAHYTLDLPFVVKGMNDFTLEFLRSKKYTGVNERDPWGPYTNIIALNLDKLRSKKIIFEYVDAIDKSDSIYVYRWGDLPLWGEVFHYFLDPNDVKLDKNLVYFHGSHNQKVNY